MRNKSVYCHSLAVAIIAGGFPAEGFPVPLGKHVDGLKAQVEGFPASNELPVELKDHRRITGELTAISREEFELSTPEPVKVRFADVRGVTEALGAQLSGGNQNASTSQHHYLRVLAIALTIGLAFLIFAAIELKKS